jgi:Flp pilus assembly protein TadG
MQQRVWDAIASLCQIFKCFRKSQTGNIGLMFGLSAIPIFLAAGAAIDYSRIANAKGNLVAALDTAALYAAAITGKTEAQMTELARNYLDQNYGAGYDASITAFSLKNYADRVEVKGTAKVKTWFMSVAGISDVDVNGASQITKVGTSIEVSLILDVTGSMEGQRMTAMKSAANDFIDTVVWQDQTPYYSKVAIIPFSEGVSLGDRAIEARGPILPGTCPTTGCARFPVQSNGDWYATKCVSERFGPAKYTDGPTNGVEFGRVYEYSAAYCPPTLVPLTNDKTLLHSTIDGLVANGGTAGHIGLAWGWYAISPNFGFWSGSSVPGPYVAGNKKLKKIAVFMTDGLLNTSYCDGVWETLVCTSPFASSVAQPGMEWWQLMTQSAMKQSTIMCDAMKAKGITVYTIGFQLTDPTADAFMRSCASGSDKYFDADKISDLKVAYSEIAQNLLELRVSQ